MPATIENTTLSDAVQAFKRATEAGILLGVDESGLYYLPATFTYDKPPFVDTSGAQLDSHQEAVVREIAMYFSAIAESNRLKTLATSADYFGYDVYVYDVTDDHVRLKYLDRRVSYDVQDADSIHNLVISFRL